MKKKYITSIIASIFITTALIGQTDSLTVDTTDHSAKYAEVINPSDLQRYLMILSSDEYEGRETTTRGANKASQYIAAQFENFKLSKYRKDKEYFQEVPFQRNAWKNIGLSINGESYKHMVDYVSLLPYNYNRPDATFKELLFCGYGIADKNYNDYKLADVKGKAILIYKGEPMTSDSTYLISGTTEPSGWSTSLDNKLKAAQGAGAALVIIIEDQVKEIVAENRKFLIDGKIRLHDGTIRQKRDIVNSVYISPSMAKTLMGDEYQAVIDMRDKILAKGKTKGKPLSIATNLNIQQEKYSDILKSNNVIGYVEGSDPDLKDEYVILSAHYDHLGIRGDKVFNGANDNGSGTSTVIQLMKAFAAAKADGHGPRRTVVGLLVCGEEKGLLGSEYYSKIPAFPLEKTIVNVNVDMVGRTDKFHEPEDEYIYIIGADKLSSELHEINEAANATYTQMELDYRFNDPKDPNRYYYRSDHYNFAKQNIPVIFYFNGVHEDYHKSTDTVDKIDFDLLTKTAKLVFHTTWELANRDKRGIHQRWIWIPEHVCLKTVLSRIRF